MTAEIGVQDLGDEDDEWRENDPERYFLAARPHPSADAQH
jgi:hypothetical protein